MMEYNEQEILQNLTIITTNNRTLYNSVDGVIPESSLNTTDVYKDNSINYQLTIKEQKILKKNRNKENKKKKKQNRINKSAVNTPNISNEVKIISPYKSSLNSEHLQLATLNVRSECNQKMHDILHKMTQHNIHILFVNEINMKPRYGKNSIKEYFSKEVEYTPFDEHFRFFINADAKQNNSGCGFIVHSSLLPYIQKINTINGRLIHIIFTFKKRNKYNSSNTLHIIGIYSPQKDPKIKLSTILLMNTYQTFFAKSLSINIT